MSKVYESFSFRAAMSRVATRARLFSYVIATFIALVCCSAVVARQEECTAPESMATRAEALSAQWKMTELRSALDLFQRASVCFGKAGRRQEQAGVLKRIGDINFSLSEYNKSLEAYEAVLEFRKQAGDRKAEGYALVDVSYPLFFIGRPDSEALQNGQTAATIGREYGDFRLVARAENVIGKVFYRRSNFTEADAHFTQALTLARQTTSQAEEAQALHNIGQLRYDGGELSVARDTYLLALPIWREVHDQQREVKTINALSVTYAVLGDNQTALEYLNGVALPLVREAGDRTEEAIAHNNIGYIYESLGDYESSLSHHRTALAIFDQLNIPLARALTSLFVGDLCRLLGLSQEAQLNYERGLVLSKEVNNMSVQADMLNGQGLLRLLEGRGDEAYELFRQSLSAYENVHNQRRQAFALNNIGWYFGGRSDWRQAANYFQRALDCTRAVGDRQHESLTLYNIARAQFELGDYVSARQKIESGLQITESLRSRVANNELRTSYFASTHRQFELYAAVLMRLHKQDPNAGFVAAAFEASENGRARTLLEILSEAHVNLRLGVDSALLTREQELQLKLNAKAERRVQLLASKTDAKELLDIEQQIDTLASEYQRVQGQIKTASPRYASFIHPAPLSLKEIQERTLDQNTILLEYALGEQRSFLWAVTPSSIKGFELPAGAEIEKIARRAYELLTVRNREVKGETTTQRMARLTNAEAQYEEVSHALSTMLLDPVAGELRDKRLVIVADGALQYLPFAGLPAPSSAKVDAPTETKFTPLIAEHEVVTLPSASVLALMRKELQGRRAAPKSVAVFADPVFEKGDERLANLRPAGGRQIETAVARLDKSTSLRGDISAATEQRALRDFDDLDAGAGIARLPFSRREAHAVMSSIPTGDGMLALGFRANRETALSPDLSNYRIVHFATHGLLNSKRPELSGILLSLYDEKGRSQRGFLELNEVYNLNLPADLVVLSACQTALGKDVKGEGLVGLTRGFMYAGAARVVASLWKVDDAATADLMGEFYRQMLGKGHKPAAALREAQIHMWQQQRWRSPFYWAAFTLQGEWN